MLRWYTATTLVASFAFFLVVGVVKIDEGRHRGRRIAGRNERGVHQVCDLFTRQTRHVGEEINKVVHLVESLDTLTPSKMYVISRFTMQHRLK